jgi:hypothetical protein
MYQYAREAGITLFTVSHRWVLGEPPMSAQLASSYWFFITSLERPFCGTTNTCFDLMAKVTMNLKSKWHARWTCDILYRLYVQILFLIQIIATSTFAATTSIFYPLLATDWIQKIQTLLLDSDTARAKRLLKWNSSRNKTINLDIVVIKRLFLCDYEIRGIKRS